jgi:hypothetical protein
MTSSGEEADTEGKGSKGKNVPAKYSKCGKTFADWCSYVPPPAKGKGKDSKEAKSVKYGKDAKAVQDAKDAEEAKAAKDAKLRELNSELERLGSLLDDPKVIQK